MEKTTKLKVLSSIGKIYEVSKRSQLEDSFFVKMDKELSFIAEYSRTTKSQALFFSIIFAENFKGNSVDFSDLIRYLECNPMKFLEFNDDFLHLCASGIFQKQKSRFKKKLSSANFQYTINEKISEAILNNEPLPSIQDEKITDVIQVLEYLNNIGEKCYYGDISTQELLSRTREVIKHNLHFPLVRNVDYFDLKIEDAFLYMYTIWKTIDGNKSIDIGRAIEAIYDNTTKRFNYLQNFLAGENILIKNNYIEIVEPQYFGCSEMKLSDNSFYLLKECGIYLQHAENNKDKKKKNNIINPDKIPYRELIFSESEMKQLLIIKNLLNDENFKKAQQRLTDKNLPLGVTVLLHGSPGTGKTEIAMQIAKETNRELMKIDISQTKSKWFGESEKIIKQIFLDYKTLTQECERTPILFINEADAVISKRKDIGSSNSAQTENALQNILLEELENFDGILLATTNLINNLDLAFERRFLFKILFQKPSVFVRTRIWKSKFPFLTMDNCEVLAIKFEFSGGQIDNILRKTEMYEIINGEQVTMDNLLAFCADETLTKEMTKVGFTQFT